MMIYQMTATFGKLENQTLTLKPGMNVIHAPNEWGKSTWCAFLINMLYGVDTKARTKKGDLADKERYLPWSGRPMCGKIDLNWNGRDITIERNTKGRIPLGEFRAYETESGLAVPELTAANCGEMLLGVERNVFQRSGFVRLADLPVTDDESLRRRLNALVTTGDESKTGDVLAKNLKDLKNKIRSNRVRGLLPEAEAESRSLREKLDQIELLNSRVTENRNRQQEMKERIALLENHQATLAYKAWEENDRRIARAQARRDECKATMDQLERQCENLPTPESCLQQREQLEQLHRQMLALDMEQGMLPTPPDEPVLPDMGTPEQAEQNAARAQLLEREQRKFHVMKNAGIDVGIGGAVLGAILIGLRAAWLGAGALALAVIAAVLGILAQNREANAKDQQSLLKAKYGGLPMEKWVSEAEGVVQARNTHRQAMEEYLDKLAEHRRRREDLNGRILALTGGKPIDQCMQHWQTMADRWQQRKEAQEAYLSAKTHAEEMAALAKPVRKPMAEDPLTDSEEGTRLQLEQSQQEIRRLEQHNSNLLGQMEVLGQKATLLQELEKVEKRVARLMQTYGALELAQEKLAEATAELQRRFSPRITKQAQQYFAQLTGGRYDRLVIDRDFSLQAGAEGEDTLCSALWRSEGTIDQMYLALRMAVSKVLTPTAPLVLDDALVRFDDVRHANAMEILRQEAEQRQLILFTCQSREEAEQ